MAASSPLSERLYIRRPSGFSGPHLASIDAYLQQLLREDSARLRKTHYFHGRHENLYVDPVNGNSGLEELDQLIDRALQLGSELLHVDQSRLRMGYWFNLMEPGQVTTLHRHDDYDELLSAVVYLKVPEHSGDLILLDGNSEHRLPPVGGDFIFFRPATPHRVSANLSTERRLSIGINFGLTDDRALAD